MRARPRLSDYKISRRIEEKRSWTNTFGVGKPPSCACACVFDKAQGPGPGLLLSAWSQEWCTGTTKSTQGPVQVRRGQWGCAGTNYGTQEPWRVQGPATMRGVLNQWPRNWPSNLLTVPVYRLIKKQTINNKQQITNKKRETTKIEHAKRRERACIHI